MNGQITANSNETKNAGLFAFKKGGNCFDALVAAQLTACVVEPFLTGFGGAGLALCMKNNEAVMVDCFTRMPKRGKKGSDFKEILLDFGPTKQAFWTGLGSIAVPGMIHGLDHIHSKYCSLPLELLAQPALKCSQQPTSITEAFGRILELLWPLIEARILRDTFGQNDVCKREGSFWLPDLKETIEDFVSYRSDIWNQNKYRCALEQNYSNGARLHLDDLNRYEVIETKLEPMVWGPNNSHIFLPKLPSVGGEILRSVLSQFNQSQLETAEDYCVLIDVLSRVNKNIEQGNKAFSKLNLIGSTTHISTVDSQGNAASMTSSLGESCGQILGDTGIILNNFLGEADVTPEAAHEHPYSRLLTMCSPTIVKNVDKVNQTSTCLAFGAGGSSRIPAAVLFGILNTELRDLNMSDVVNNPRLHLDEKELHIEEFSPQIQDYLENYAQKHFQLATKKYKGSTLFFGALNVSKIKKSTSTKEISLDGAGDFRRGCVSGSYKKDS